MSRAPLVHLVAGARPNFMKIAPIVRALRGSGRLRFKLVHTGQHHDREMNEVFFEELGIPPPGARLGCGGGSHAEQTAKIMVAYEALCRADRPEATLVVGDVNSTLACAITAKKLGVPVAHVEAGLRSGDMRMPEEVNRRVTDAICDWYFVTEPSGCAHLAREGVPAERVFEVGNVMVDNLLYQAGRLARMDAAGLQTDAIKRRLGRYGVVTLHRAGNVDDPATLAKLAQALRELSAQLPLVFPVHPRTRERMAKYAIELGPKVELLGPQPYMAFLHLWKDAAVVLTDSGGLQEETTALGVPCVTLRENTERPITIEQGTNVLAGIEPGAVLAAARAALEGRSRTGRRPALWDGHAAERIVAVLSAELAPDEPAAVRGEGEEARARRIELFGCHVDNLTMQETVEAVGRMIAGGRPAQHVVVNVDKIVKASRDEALRRIINQCDLINADGMPIVWASRLLGKPLKERVTGIDLFEALMRRAARTGWRVYLLGARPEVVERVAALYPRKYPGLRIVGYRDGYWSEADEAAVVERIRECAPQLLFVAMSSPKKERFLRQWQSRMGVPFAMGVGGTFDVAAGVIGRAPLWMQRSGLEWFYRFLQEPRRMFRRYFVEDMAFFWLLARELAARRGGLALLSLVPIVLWAVLRE